MLPEAKAKEIRNWLLKAARDLAVCGMNLKHDPPITDDALFHCQQAVEKSIKSFLVLHDRRFKKTHIIGELAKLLLEDDPTLEALFKQATELTPYATMFRYPGELVLPAVQDALNAQDLAKKVFDSILARIPAEARP